MITEEQELMMTLLIDCGLSKTNAALLTLTLETNQNFAKMAEWLQSRRFKASEQEMCNKVADIAGYKRITE